MEEINILCKRADTYLHSAQMLINEQDFNSAVSRTYYAMFYMKILKATLQAYLEENGFCGE
jgi:uncharacterized protein (UPF0332 family)